MPANSTYSFSGGQILSAADLNAVFAQTVAFAADSSNANTGTLPELRLPYRMDQNVRTTDSVQFVDGTFTGNLIVSGTMTYVNTSVLDIKDKNITIAKGSANSSIANNAGLYIEGAEVNFYYDDSSNVMVLDHLLSIGNSTVNAVFGFSNTALAGGQFVGNVNNYFQVIATNANTGPSASGDYVVADDAGVDSNNYVNMGINGSGWSNTEWTINGPSDSYLYAAGGNLAIGTADRKSIVFFANGTLEVNEAMQIDAGANVNIGNTKSGATSLTIGNTTVNAVINSSSFNINSVFTANSTVVNAASYRINTTFIANTTGIYHTGVVNANAFTTSSVTVNTNALTIGANVLVNTSKYFVGNSTVNTDITAGLILISGQTINSSVFTGSANYLGGTAANGYQTTAGLAANVATLTANNANYLNGVNAASYVTNTGAFTISGVHTHTANIVMSGSVIIANGAFGNTDEVLISNGTAMYWGQFSANNTLNLVGANGYNYVQNTDSRTMSGNLVFSGANVAVTGNMRFANGSQLLANGSFGTAGQVLVSNGSSMYWGAGGITVYYADGSQAYP